MSKRQAGTILAFICYVILFASMGNSSDIKWSSCMGTDNNMTWNPYRGTSIYNIYKERYKNPNNFGRYLIGKGKKSGELYKPETYNREAYANLKADKNIFYFYLFSNSWLQQYPLPVRDLFRTEEIGAAENWGVLGKYVVRLNSIQNNFKKYHIENPYQALTREDVRVVGKQYDFTQKSKEVFQYLKEHYPSDVCFSMEQVCDDVTVGRYMLPLDTEDMKTTGGTVKISYEKESAYDGLAQFRITNCRIKNLDFETDTLYIQLSNDSGKKYIFTTMADGMDLQSLTYNNRIDEGEYAVSCLFLHNDVWYCAEDISAVKIRK